MLGTIRNPIFNSMNAIELGYKLTSLDAYILLLLIAYTLLILHKQCILILLMLMTCRAQATKSIRKRLLRVPPSAETALVSIKERAFSIVAPPLWNWVPSHSL